METIGVCGGVFLGLLIAFYVMITMPEYTRYEDPENDGVQVYGPKPKRKRKSKDDV